MSFYDELRAGMAEVARELMVPATLTRTNSTETDDDRAADRAAGRKTTVSTQTITGLGVFVDRKVRLADGALKIEATATLTVEPRKNDKLTIGGRTLTVLTVEEVNPTGADTGIVYRVTLK